MHLQRSTQYPIAYVSRKSHFAIPPKTVPSTRNLSHSTQKAAFSLVAGSYTVTETDVSDIMTSPCIDVSDSMPAGLSCYIGRASVVQCDSTRLSNYLLGKAAAQTQAYANLRTILAM